MIALFEAYFERLQAIHQDFVKAIAGVSQEGLDWVPGEDMNSMVVLVVHTMGSQRYWIGDVVGGDDSARDRDAEFLAKGLDFDALKARIDEIEAHSLQTLKTLTLEDLDEIRQRADEPDKTFTVAWALEHSLQHTALHLGHIQITRQLWDQRQ